MPPKKKQKQQQHPQVQVYRVREPFSTRVNGVRQVYAPGQNVYQADHPMVRKYGELFFEPVFPVETATAAPGEVRSVRLPPVEEDPESETESEPVKPEAED